MARGRVKNRFVGQDAHTLVHLMPNNIDDASNSLDSSGDEYILVVPPTSWSGSYFDAMDASVSLDFLDPFTLPSNDSACH